MKTILLSLSFLVLAACSEIKNIDIYINAPSVVQLDENFEIILKIVNTSNSVQKLNSIDIADKYLSGIMVIKTEPEYKESMHIVFDNTVSYSFGHNLPPNDTTAFVLQCKAVKNGDFQGDFDFCINSDINFISKNIRTIVR